MRKHYLLLFIALLCAKNVNGDTLWYSYQQQNKWMVTSASSTSAAPSNYAASAAYQANMNMTGWATLDISTNPSQDDVTQAYGAGYLEGYISADVIQDWMVNTAQCDGVPTDDVNAFLVKNEQWMRQQIANCASTNNCGYWNQVNMMLVQLDGLTDGYNNASAPNKRLTSLQLLGRQAFDEWSDIMTALNLTSNSPLVPPATAMLRDHCSVLVKVTDDLQHLYNAHVTWGHFCHSLRIFKHYNMNFQNSPSSTVSFSSFPGALFSGDDYYINDKGLSVTETTNDVFVNSLFANVTIYTVPFWVRVAIATRGASSGQEWVEIFSQYNSGTYNNQWQVIDYKLFTPGHPLKPNTLWIAEQIPGYVVSADVTSDLIEDGYFPSYNVPYFEFIYNISGYPAQYKQYGNAYSHEYCPRANIFRRDQAKVQTLDDFKNIMRYNDYLNDPLSLGDACNGISARCDLNPPGKPGLTHEAFGGYDCKVTDNQLIKNMTTHALSGPSSETLPPFAWKGDWASVPHIGQPPIYQFPFVAMNPLN